MPSFLDRKWPFRYFYVASIVPIDIRRNTLYGKGKVRLSVRRGRRGDQRHQQGHPRRQGRRTHGDDQDRASRPGRLHDRHPGLRGIFQVWSQAAQEHRRRDQASLGQAREDRRQEARRSQGSAPRIRPFGRGALDAGHARDHPQPRAQRQIGRGPRRQDRQSPLCLRQLPTLHPDVFHHRHGPLQGTDGGDAHPDEKIPRRKERYRAFRRKPQEALRGVQNLLQVQEG